MDNGHTLNEFGEALGIQVVRETNSHDPRTHEKDEEGQDRRLNFNLKPILILMTMSGCYDFQCTNTFFQCFHRIFKVLVAIILIAYGIRCIVLFTDPSLMFTYISILLLCCLSLGNCLISLKTFSRKYGNYQKAMDDFEQVISIVTDQKIHVDMNYFRRRNILIFINSIVLFLGSEAVQAVTYFGLSPTDAASQLVVHNTSTSMSLTAPFEDSPTSRIVMFIPLSFLILPFTTPPCFLMVVSSMLLTIFNGLNRHMDTVVKDDPVGFIRNINTYRKIHMKLCSIISDLDKDLGYFYGNICVWVVGIGIVVLYILLKFKQNFVVVFILIYYIGLAMFVLSTVSISAALVHEAAHAPLDTIYNIDVKDASLDQVTQLNLFLSKLTGTQVGFTTCGLLTITKEFILTIAGVFLTYFAVLYTL